VNAAVVIAGEHELNHLTRVDTAIVNGLQMPDLRSERRLRSGHRVHACQILVAALGPVPAIQDI
jgi:hypothetical protein